MKRLLFVLLISVSGCSDSKEGVPPSAVTSQVAREPESQTKEGDFAEQLKRNGVEVTIVPTKIEELKLQSDDPYAQNDISGGFYVSGQTVWLLPNDESYASGFARIDLKDQKFTKFNEAFVGIVDGSIFFRDKEGTDYSKITSDLGQEDSDPFLGGNATLMRLNYKPVRAVFPFSSASRLLTTWIDENDLSHISMLDNATKWPPTDLARGQVYNWSLNGRYVLVRSAGEKAKVFEIGTSKPVLECGDGSYFISDTLICLESYALNPLRDESLFDTYGDFYVMKVIDLASRKETKLAIKCRLFSATFIRISSQEILAIDSGSSSLISDNDSDKYYVLTLPDNKVLL